MVQHFENGCMKADRTWVRSASYAFNLRGEKSQS